MNIAQLQAKLAKCEALAKDKSTTSHERKEANKAAEKIRNRLKLNIGDDLEYNDLVLKGKAAAKKIDSAGWELGEYVSKVQSTYGEGKLKQYAKDIGVNYNTLCGYKRAYLAFEKTPRGVFSIGAGKALAAIKDETRRFQIVKENPNITASAAEEKVREWKEERKREREKRKKIKSKSNGKGDQSPDKYSQIPTLSGILQSYLKSTTAELIKELHSDVDEENRRLILSDLKDLQHRVNQAIKLWSKGE